MVIALLLFLAFVNFSHAETNLEGIPNDRWISLQGQLRSLETRSAKRPLRILQIGDSHTAGDYFTGHLRSELQKAGRNAGPGFLPPGKLKAYRYSQVVFSSSAAWEISRDRKPADQSALGIGGFIAGGTQPFQMLQLMAERSPVPSTLTIYLRHKENQVSGLNAYVDGNYIAPSQISELSKTGDEKLVRLVFNLEASGGTLSLVAGRELPESALLGIYWESKVPGVVFSHLGFNGAKFSEMDHWSSQLVQVQMKDMAPDLVILAFGTNDAFDEQFSLYDLKSNLLKVEEWLKKNVANAAVLVLLPPDALTRSGNCIDGGLDSRHAIKSRPKKSEELRCIEGEHGNQDGNQFCHLRSHPNLNSVRMTLRELAKEYSWKVWDWSALTGDSCGVRKWNLNGEPLYRKDGVHLTPNGYAISAQSLLDTLRKE